MKSSTESALTALQRPVATCARLIVVVMAILLSAGQMHAQTPDPQPPGHVSDPARPALNPFPAEQDWSFLARPAQHPDFFDPVKYIRLGDGRTEVIFLWDWSIARSTSTTTTGCSAPDLRTITVTYLSRVMPHFDLHAGPDFRLFSGVQVRLYCGKSGRTQDLVSMKIAEMFIRHFSRSVRMSVANMAVVCGLGDRRSCLDRDACSTTTKART